MVLKIVGATLDAVLPTDYYKHAAAAVVGTLVVRAFSQGRTTSRERDLHARIVLLTGAFTPLGLSALESLAQRGAHVIALSPEPVDAPHTELIIQALRDRTNNTNIWAEQCILTSPVSIRAFCTRFLTGQDTRVDALVFAHEYPHIGPLLGSPGAPVNAAARETGTLATFLLTTLLLPALLVAPAERDIRILTLVNPFYAAALPSFAASIAASATPSPSADSNDPLPAPHSTSTVVAEGHRALRSAILTRHLQRILDALPNRAPAPPTEGPESTGPASTIPVVSQTAQRSNIVSLTVSPGVSRADTVALFLGARTSWLGLFIYMLFYPLLYILTRTSYSALQTVLHALFLPTPYKLLGGGASADVGEMLKPGALYADCAVVQLKIPAPPAPTTTDTPPPPTSEKGKENAPEVDPASGLVPIPDDGELGGERLGRMTWESLEVRLKRWEEENPDPPAQTTGTSGLGSNADGSPQRPGTPPTVDPDAGREAVDETKDVYA